jgi:predicted phosphate transport protein (TIGR00153 family)
MVVARRSESIVPAPLDTEGRERRTLARRLRWLLRPRDRRFFTLFNRHAALCVEGLGALAALLANVTDPDGRVRDVETIEKGADRVVDEVRQLLGRSLFPPFSRTIVYDLINRLDDILDLAEDAAQSLHLYHVTRLTPEAVRLAELAVSSAEKLQSAVMQLAQLESPRSILALCAEVDLLEAQADHVMRAAMARLFREESDASQLVKLKAIYELLESLTDRCKDVGNAIEGIVLKHG